MSKLKRLYRLFATLSHLDQRLDRLDKYAERTINRRYAAIDELADYLVGAQLPGDYLEFGVYRGSTFAYAYEQLSIFPAMKFFAFDSFEGLPPPRGIDAMDGYSSNFHEHEFACGQDEFVDNLKQAGVDLARVRIVPGWYKDTLYPQKASTYGVDKVAAAWIDVDLYESTPPVLDFLTNHLMVGSVLLFDDWHCFRNLPDFGEQRACREWLTVNSQITLNELFSFGSHGLAFTVGSC